MRRLWLGAQVVLAVAVVAFLARSLAGNWAAIRASGTALHLDAAPLAAAVGITLATYAMLVSAWRAVLLGWNERLPYPQAARIWCLSNLARYVPGRIWQIAGMAAMAGREGVSPWAAAGSAVVVQLLAITTGGVVTVIFAPQAGQPLLVIATAAAAAAAVAALSWPRATVTLTGWLRRITRRDLRLEPVAPGPLVLAAAVTTLAWLAYGVAFYCFVLGILGETALTLRGAIGAFTASYLVGLLLIFTPGGLGPREGTIYALLVGPLGPGPAFVVMVGSRVLLTVTEIVAALVMLPFRGSRAPSA